MSDPLSIVAAAREAGGRPAIITKERTWTFAQCAATLDRVLTNKTSACFTPDETSVNKTSACFVPDRTIANKTSACFVPDRTIANKTSACFTPDETSANKTSACFAAEPNVATILGIYAGLEQRRTLALVRPRQPVDVRALPDDGALVLFTSGSTGAPRGVVHTRESLLAAVAANPLGRGADDRWLLCLPLAHAGGASIVLRCLVARRPLVLHEGDFEAGAVAELARAATLVSLVPAQLAALLDVGARLPTVLLGGAPAPPALLARAAASGVRVLVTYGMTETFGQVATAHAPGELPRALGGVTIHAGTRAEPATIRICGPMLAARYLDGAPIAPELATADLGFVEDGALHVVGRADDIIITGGENVHPAAIEAVLAATPGVRGACVFGVPDARWGELVAAVLAIDGAFDRGAALARWHAALPAHARPRRLAAVAALPLLASGKIDRRAAAALAAEPIEYP